MAPSRRRRRIISSSATARSSPGCISWSIFGAREGLTDPAHIDRSLREAAEAAGATILHSHFHHFAPNGGVSGVVVLAESHISIHTWPERNFAAVDIFMCGECDPYLSLPVLKAAFKPESVDIDEHRRGIVD